MSAPKGPLQRSRDVAWHEIQGEAVVLSPEDWSVNVLNETASRIWELFESPRSVDDVVAALTEEYDVDDDTARKEVEAFAEELGKRGLLVPADPRGEGG
ncbi:PqqD family protein [Elusimicrobiota bacterium]